MNPVSFSLDEAVEGYDHEQIDHGNDDGSEERASTATVEDGPDDDYMNEEDMFDDEDGSFGDLEGYADLGNDDYGEVEVEETYNSDNVTRISLNQRPAHYSRTTKAAERSAQRTRFNESDTFFLIEGDSPIGKPPTRVQRTGSRRKRPASDSLIADSKKITADLDSDDELIMNMRDKGYTDTQIANRLAKEGRVKYDRKSISTRIGRIKEAQGAHIDYLIEEGYKEWEYEDDILLMQAYELANIEVLYEIERIRTWRFKKVSEYMRRLNAESIFSAKSCRERYSAIMNGSAVIPSGLDDNPEARRMEIEAFREHREGIREAERFEKEEELARERLIKEEARLRQAEKEQQIALAREDRAKEKAERSMRRAAQNQMRLQRAQDNKLAKIQRAQQMRAQKLTDKAAQVQRINDMNPNISVPGTPIADLRNLSPDTPDPRSFLSIDGLKALCARRALSADGQTVKEFVRRLRDADEVYTVPQLKSICRSKGLNVGANKPAIRYQLALAEAKEFASFD